jgi:hypothetical protein
VLLVLLLHLIILLGCGRARRRGVASHVAFFLRAPRRSGGGLAGARLEELEDLEELEGLTASAKSWRFFRKPPFFWHVSITCKHNEESGLLVRSIKR